MLRPRTPAIFEILSLARYERQKNVGLAIAALAILRQRLPPQVFGRLQLVVAGGFTLSAGANAAIRWPACRHRRARWGWNKKLFSTARSPRVSAGGCFRTADV